MGGCMSQTADSFKLAASAVPTNKDLTPKMLITRDKNSKIIGPNIDTVKQAITSAYPKAEITEKDGEENQLLVECNNKVVWDKKEDGLFDTGKAESIFQRLKAAAQQ